MRKRKSLVLLLALSSIIFADRANGAQSRSGDRLILRVAPARICLVHDNGRVECTSMQELLGFIPDQRSYDQLYGVAEKLRKAGVAFTEVIPFRCGAYEWAMLTASSSRPGDTQRMIAMCTSLHTRALNSILQKNQTGGGQAVGGLPDIRVSRASMSSVLDPISSAIATCRSRGAGAVIDPRWSPSGLQAGANPYEDNYWGDPARDGNYGLDWYKDSSLPASRATDGENAHMWGHFFWELMQRASDEYRLRKAWDEKKRQEEEAKKRDEAKKKKAAQPKKDTGVFSEATPVVRTSPVVDDYCAPGEECALAQPQCIDEACAPTCPELEQAWRNMILGCQDNWQSYSCQSFYRRALGCPDTGLIFPNPEGDHACGKWTSAERLAEIRYALCKRSQGLMSPPPEGQLPSCADRVRQYTYRQPGDICNDPRARPLADQCTKEAKFPGAPVKIEGWGPPRPYITKSSSKSGTPSDPKMSPKP